MEKEKQRKYQFCIEIVVSDRSHGKKIGWIGSEERNENPKKRKIRGLNEEFEIEIEEIEVTERRVSVEILLLLSYGEFPLYCTFVCV
jgi:hypothetical protein